MSYELQLSSGIFALMVRTRLRREVHLCIDREIATLFGNLVVDRVEIAPETTVQQQRAMDPETFVETPASTYGAWIFRPNSYSMIEVPCLQVKQAVDIVLVPAPSLIVAGVEPTVPLLTFRMHVILNVTAHVDNQTQGGSEDVTLRYEVAYVDPGNARQHITPEQLQQLRDMIALVSLPSTTVNLSQLSGIVGEGSDARIRNAAIVCDPAGTRVALRLEADVYRSPVKIGSAFFVTGPEDHLQGRDWAFLVDADVMVTNVTAVAREALESQASIRLRHGPNVTWSPGTTSVVVTARIELIDACPFFIDDVNLDVNARINVGFAVPADTPDTLKTTFNITGKPARFGEVLGCSITPTVLWPVVGPILLKRMENPLDAFTTYFAIMVLTPLVAITAVIMVFEAQTLSEDISQDLGNHCGKVNDELYICTENVDLLLPIFGNAPTRLSVVEVVGRTAGLVMRGTIRRPPDVPVALAHVSASDLGWNLDGDCKGGFFIANQAQIDVSGGGHHLCGWRLLSADPLGVYEITPSGDSLRVRTHFHPGFLDNPYGCQLRVITTGGVRTITYPPPTPITNEEKEQLERLKRNFEGVCRKIAAAITERQVVNWGRDDPIDQLDTLRLWEIAVLGLPANDRVVLRDPRGNAIVEATASQNGVAHVMNAFAGVDKPQAIALESAATDAHRLTVTQRQTLYRRVASLPARTAPESIELNDSFNAIVLSIRTRSGRSTWNVATPEVPVLLESRSNVEAESLTSEREELIAGLRIRRDLIPPRLGGMRNVVVAEQGEQTLLVDMSDHARPRIAQRYPGAAWFEKLAASGRLIARYDAARATIDLYVVEASDGDLELCSG